MKYWLDLNYSKTDYPSWCLICLAEPCKYFKECDTQPHSQAVTGGGRFVWLGTRGIATVICRARPSPRWVRAIVSRNRDSLKWYFLHSGRGVRCYLTWRKYLNLFKLHYAFVLISPTFGGVTLSLPSPLQFRRLPPGSFLLWRGKSVYRMRLCVSHSSTVFILLLSLYLQFIRSIQFKLGVEHDEGQGRCWWR